MTRRFRIPAVFCAVAMLICELVSRPYANMGICDDGPYVLVAHALATTGHIAYNGWSAAMLAWQLYLAAAFIKVFGFSFTAVRMSTLLVAAVLAFVLQRTFVLAGISERNSVIGTLALVLSPLYLELSVTFMSDIHGLFAIALCLYACLRAIQSDSDRSTVFWICFAVATNVLVGTSRQIAWLGALVMIPSALWLLRRRRRVLMAGAVITLLGAIFIFACMRWLKLQQYTNAVPLWVSDFPIMYAFGQLWLLLLDIPFLLLPLSVLFLPQIRKAPPRVVVTASVSLLGFFFLASYPSRLRSRFSAFLEPTGGGRGSCVGVHGIIEVFSLQAGAPIFLGHWAQILLTIVCFGGLFGLVVLMLRYRKEEPTTNSLSHISWQQLGVLMAPFTLAYLLLLLSAAGTTIDMYDRYALGLLPFVVILAVRLYQERVETDLSPFCVISVLIMAIYGIAVTHSNFSFYRARVALANELQSEGIPATSVDNGWEYDFVVELQHANHLNVPLIKVPAGAYVPIPPPPGICKMWWYDRTPHIHALYGVSYDRDACAGPAPFAPVHYSRWPYREQGTLYVVRYTATPQP